MTTAVAPGIVSQRQVDYAAGRGSVVVASGSIVQTVLTRRLPTASAGTHTVTCPRERSPQMGTRTQTEIEMEEVMRDVLHGKRIAILATDGVERREYEQPGAAVRDAGAEAELLSLKSGSIDARDHDLQPAGEVTVDREVAGASVDEFDALVIPGGTVNAVKLRLDGAAIAFGRDFGEAGKPGGGICHGPWTLVEAGVAKGRTLTSYPSLRTDLRNAGAHVVDEEVVIDGNIISSRSPEDLPAFCAAIVDLFASA